MNKVLLTIFAAIISVQVIAQQIPVINSISPTRASAGSTVVIAGSGFPTDAANVQVKLGKGIASVSSITSNLIEVVVPANATFGPVTVTNLTSGAIGQSSVDFAMSYGGGNFDIANLSDPVDIDVSQQFVFDLCECDLDGDGQSDYVITARQNTGAGQAKRVVYQNNSTQSSVSLTPVLELGNKPAVSITCADLTGDGKPELIATQKNGPNDTGQENVEIYINNSTTGNISFTPDPNFTFFLPRDNEENIRTPWLVRAADLDLDGKLDLIISNEQEETLLAYRNTYNGSLGFDSPVEIVVTGATEPVQIFDVRDLNNDNLPDIVAAPFGGGTISVFQNISINGNVELGDEQQISPNSSIQIRNISITDINNDGFSDIVLADLRQSSSTLSDIVVAFNESRGNPSQISISSEVNSFELNNQPPGFRSGFGDINGDGNLDITGSIINGQSTTLELLRNDGLDGAGSQVFSDFSLDLNFNTRVTLFTELNNDGIPDLIFTSNSLEGANGFLSYIQNNNCLRPTIEAPGETYCNGVPFILETNHGANLSYQWEVNEDGAGFANAGTGRNLDISTYTGDLQVRVVATNAATGCSETSDITAIEANSLTPNNPTINAVGSVCAGDELTLATPTAADAYTWSGPNGFEQTTTTGTVTVATSAQSANSGTFTLTVQVTGGCQSAVASELVEISSPPTPIINVDGLNNFCEGGSTTLTTSAFPGYSIQWNSEGTAISGETTSSLSVSQTANYTVTYTDDISGCTNTSATTLIQSVERPSSTIDAVSEVCIDVPFDVTAQTTSSNPDFTLAYQWELTDAGNNSIDSDNIAATTFTLGAAGEYNIALSTGYQEIANCENTVNAAVTASAPPALEITAPNGTEKCPESTVLLEAPAGQASYLWSNGDTTPTTEAQTPADQEEATITVEIVTPIGCEVTSSIDINDFPNSGLTITPITEGVDFTPDNELPMPDGETSIELEASNGSDFSWSPPEIFDNPTSARVTVTPRDPSTEIILAGTDINECSTQETFTLLNNSIVGRKSFSPDGNGLGFDCWEIVNSRELNGCTVYIFDKRGRNIFVGETPFENDCVWDGNIQTGQQAPEGVYYYVLKCDDPQSEGFEQSGSILLARDNN